MRKGRKYGRNIPRRAENALTKSAETGEGNLLALAVDAARKRATLGEISSALEKVWGRYQAVIRSISGVYSAENTGDEKMPAGIAIPIFTRLAAAHTSGTHLTSIPA